MKDAYPMKDIYPMWCYSGDMGDLIFSKDGFIEVGGFDECNYLSEHALEEIKQKYNFDKFL